MNKNIKEGIDIIKTDDKRLISVNNKHQNYVDTNNYENPYLFYTTIDNYPVYSIFKRENTKDKIDANPLINALKQRRGWEFVNAKKDLLKLLRNFVSAAKLLPKYDTIIMTPSNNQLNKIVFNYLIRLIEHDKEYENFFEKLSAQDVYDNLIDDNFINNKFVNPNRVWNDIDDAFAQMEEFNDGIFSYKYLQKSKYRNIIIQSMKINANIYNEILFDNTINKKDILIFDDTITTGKTISDSGQAIKSMFIPNSITYITLFSAIDGDIKQIKYE